ncbi:hypothetical protein ANN_10383 [Periplaneta americana]|uniref:Uncharacterized protein n=1 Tax=Periplaneta americana TaxID=6978 RepID=A0ABQ8TRN6_PERAM|nr:hypothetical protein ANN_10383 [Periplaneta americana]
MGRRRGRDRQQPMFPPNAWNCYIRTRENLPRTTNAYESWHRRLNTLMGKAYPSFYHVLQLLQEETARIHQDIEKLEAADNDASAAAATGHGGLGLLSLEASGMRGAALQQQ